MRDLPWTALITVKSEAHSSSAVRTGTAQSTLDSFVANHRFGLQHKYFSRVLGLWGVWSVRGAVSDVAHSSLQACFSYVPATVGEFAEIAT